MKVIRKQTIDTETFELGDEIRFKLTNGEKVRAKAVQKCEKGMLFITKDCVGKEMPMYENTINKYLDYAHSDLRKYLNSELIFLFPEEIRSRIVPTITSDYLRIPTVKQIFGENTFGAEESCVKQFYGMKHRRNRIAFTRTDGNDKFQWYWLQDNISGVNFAYVDSNGDAGVARYFYARGIRLVFNLRTH
jgi:hypothetical protein